MGWTDISDSRIDADSFVNVGLVGDMTANPVYNHDHAIRSGTHTTGARTCMARGKTQFSWSDVTTGTQAVSFSDALDGDPNFLAAPVVSMRLEESPAGEDWVSNGPATVYLEDDTLDEAGFTARVDFSGSAFDPTGWVHWIAIGEVQAGE
jgi:hypothetical protein